MELGPDVPKVLFLAANHDVAAIGTQFPDKQSHGQGRDRIRLPFCAQRIAELQQELLPLLALAQGQFGTRLLDCNACAFGRLLNHYPLGVRPCAWTGLMDCDGAGQPASLYKRDADIGQETDCLV